MAHGRQSVRRLSGLRQGQNQRSRKMIRNAYQTAVAEDMGQPAVAEPPAADEHIAPAPRVSVQAFCETVETAAAVQAAGEDRRLAKAHVKIQMGGIAAAIEAYRSSATPNVIVIEADTRAEEILGGLDHLAEVCDAGTRGVVIGRINDVTLYRELTRRGVSDYMISPVGTLDVVRSICGLYSAPDAKPVGRIVAVVGAKGGVGASTIAHNIAYAIGGDFGVDSVVADLDLPFGTAGLDYNQAPPQGIADAVFSPDRIDRGYDFGAEAFDAIIDTLRNSVPCIVLDVPHVWSGWTRRLLVGADDILIVAAPDLANLRNAKNMVDLLRVARPHDRHAYYCLNQVGVPKRPEITPADFAKALEDQPLASIPFEPQLFGTAANNGQMIAEVSANHKTAEMLRQLAQVLTGRADAKRARSSLLTPLLAKLRKKSA